MTVARPPIVAMDQVVRSHGALRPLRIAHFVVESRDRVVLSGLDAAAGEAFVHLVTGATLPESGEVVIDGRSTRLIAQDTEWLASLDRFGLVSDRAVLVGALSVGANLALPLTLAVDPMADETRERVAAMAREVDLESGRLGAPAGTLTPEERVRVHLARALAAGPHMLILEHPTSPLATAEARGAFGRLVSRVAAGRDIGWVAISEDEVFAEATGARRLALAPATGVIGEFKKGWRRWL